jgi:hypothetical protein
MKVLSVPDASTITRKVYVLEENEQEYLNFTEGIEVLPAQYFENDYGATFYFRKRYEPGERFYPEGGYEIIEENGARRSFDLDALIVHPKHFKRKEKAAKIRKTDGKRGRPKIDPSLKKINEVYVPTGGKRGRPKKDPTELKSIVYVKTGGKRGRPKKNS